MDKTINFTRELNICNVGSLPAGLGCKYLLCIRGQDGALVAKRWCRKRPTPEGIEVVVIFGR